VETMFRLTMRSTTKKLGPIPSSISSSDTCPECALAGAGCYAENHPLKGRWDETDRGEHATGARDFLRKIRDLFPTQLWRWAMAGDLPHENGDIDASFLEALVKANQGRRGFGYTHHHVVHHPGNRALIAAANKGGFTLNLSANTLEEADRLAGLAIGPVVVIQAHPEGERHRETTPGGRLVETCPATYKPMVTCEKCELCQRGDRNIIVGFPAHGNRRKTVHRLASGESHT